MRLTQNWPYDLSFEIFQNTTTASAKSTVYLTHPPTSDAYMRQWTGPTLIQVVALRLFGAKYLLEPKLTYNQLVP